MLKKKEIQKFLKKYNIKNYVINEDLTVDVLESVFLGYKSLTKFPFKFGKISGNFFCPSNKLTSLKNSPDIIEGDFNCSFNELISLEHCPKEIKGSFNCSYNKLINLEHTPKVVEDNFNCSNNQLTSLVNTPETINGDFDCSNNQLTSLEHCPKKIKGSFFCYNNKFRKKLLFNFDSIIENYINSDFGTKKDFFDEVKKQKILKEKKVLNKSVITSKTYQKTQKRL